MTSARQIAANRRNASKRTGPTTEQGKQRSRNAMRLGLTAETAIATLEDEQDYKAFEEAISADFYVHSAVNEILVLRLAGLLRRLRTTRIEAGMFDNQAIHLTIGMQITQCSSKSCTRSWANPRRGSSSEPVRMSRQAAWSEAAPENACSDNASTAFFA
jgi:hypothetical protein